MNRQSETVSQDGMIVDDGELTFDSRSYIKTLTPAAVGFHPERCITHDRPVCCGRFWGEVRGVVQARAKPEDPKSEMLTLLEGDFKADAYNDDGEVFGFRGDWCAPPVGQSAIMSELAKQADAGAENPLVEFDLEIWALPANNPTKRKWGARDLMPRRAGPLNFLSDETAAARRRAYAEAVGGSFSASPQIEHSKA